MLLRQPSLHVTPVTSSTEQLIFSVAFLFSSHRRNALFVQLCCERQEWRCTGKSITTPLRVEGRLWGARLGVTTYQPWAWLVVALVLHLTPKSLRFFCRFRFLFISSMFMVLTFQGGKSGGTSANRSRQRASVGVVRTPTPGSVGGNTPTTQHPPMPIKSLSPGPSPMSPSFLTRQQNTHTGAGGSGNAAQNISHPHPRPYRGSASPLAVHPAHKHLLPPPVETRASYSFRSSSDPGNLSPFDDLPFPPSGTVTCMCDDIITSKLYVCLLQKWHHGSANTDQNISSVY